MIRKSIGMEKYLVVAETSGVILAETLSPTV
jgi:hypothetical protein